MSLRVALSAVAVKAKIGVEGIFRYPRFVYAGRKSCPHDEIQCASSIDKTYVQTIENIVRKDKLSGNVNQLNSI
jgi:hypothetical protein